MPNPLSDWTEYQTSLSASTVNGVCLSQTPSAASDLTLNGSLVTRGVARLDTGQIGNNPANIGRQVLFTFAGADASRTLTVYGTLVPGGNVVSEAVAGANTSTSTSVNYFITITRIVVDAAFAGAVQVGTNGVGASPWVLVKDRQNWFGLAVLTYNNGTVNWTIQHTGNNLLDPNVIPYAFDHSVIANKSSATDGNYAFPPIGIRTKINSGTGTVTTELNGIIRG